MKRRAVLSLLFCVLASVVLSACAKPPVLEQQGILGVWWWSDSLGDEYMEFAAGNSVTEIYYCSSKFNGDTDCFIQNANDRGMDVYWLAGEYQWVEKPDSLHKQMEKFKTYQASHEHSFAGVHLDIEPHQHPEFKSRREELITKFVELTRDMAARYPELWIEYDIPFWLEDEVTVEGVKKPAYAHIIDSASRVTLMSYRDTAEKIYKSADAEIAYALASGKTLNLGVETKSNEGDRVSFQEEGKAVMYNELEKLRAMLPDGFGIVIHQIQHWFDLKD